MFFPSSNVKNTCRCFTRAFYFITMIDFRFTTITPDVDYVDYVDRIMWTKMNNEDKMPIQSCLKETQIDDFPINDKDLKTSLPPWLHDLIMKSSFVILVILLNLVFI